MLVIAAFTFLPTIRNGFVNFDDDQNFTRNFDFRGIDWSHIRWALTTDLIGVYQPLGWIFLELQWAFWGLDPRAYHLASVAMHCLNGALIYKVCTSLLGRVGVGRATGRDLALGSFLASALFVAHPLRTECVAWASCQTFLPSASFLMLGVLAYLAASRDFGPARMVWLATSWCMYAASLGCKGVAVGLPVVLLLLDVYPLRRLGPWREEVGASPASIWAEKVPFLILGMAFLIRGVIAKQAHGALEPVRHDGVSSRVAQACYGACFYPAKTLVPSNLNAFYSLPPRVSLGESTFLVSFVTVVSVLVVMILLRRRWPGLLVAWLSYLVLLAPNLGVVRIGRLLVADRYSYIATLPGVVLSAYLLARLLAGPPWRRRGVVALAGATVLVLAAASWRQCGTWKTSSALWTQAVTAGSGQDDSLRTYLGVALAEEGRLDEAILQFVEAVDLQPRSPESRVNLAMALEKRGSLGGATKQLAEAIRLRPNYVDAHIKLGTVLARRGRLVEAREQFSEARRISSGDPGVLNDIGIAFGRLGLFDDAIAGFTEAVRLRPDDPRFRHNLNSARRDAEKGSHPSPP